MVAIVGQTERSAMGGAYQQEVDLLTLFKDVCSDYVQMCTVPEQLPNLIDRAIRIAISESAPTAIIIPSDVFDLEYVAPGHAFKQVPSSLGMSASTVTAEPSAVRQAADILNAGEKVALLVGQGARGCVQELTQIADLLGAGAAKALLGKDVLSDELPWVTGSIGLLGHDRVLQDDDGLRHAAHRRLELPLHPVHAEARSGPGDPDRPLRQVDRHALPLRAEPRRRRQSHPAGADPAAATAKPTGPGGRRSRPTSPTGGRPSSAGR